MSTQANNKAAATMGRSSVYVEGFTHVNPIPAACRIGHIVYSSTIHGIEQPGDGSAPTLERQAQLMFSRLRDVVEAAGASTDDVIKVTMWMADRSDRDVVNRFWLGLFPDETDRPARQTVNARLDGEQLIQCDFVAVINSERGDQRS